MFEKQLEIPKSIIVLKNGDPITQERLVQERKPYLVAGYAITNYNEYPQFSFQATINCNHSQFWLVLTSIINLIPDPIIFSIGDYPNVNEVAGNYSNEQLITILSKYAESLTKDTEIRLLINHQNENSAFQLYVSDCKYFEIYSSDDSKIIKLMIDLGLPEIKNLATVNEFPRTMIGQPIENTQSLLSRIRSALEKI